MWDEAIYANNALEMAKNHNFLITTNEGGNDFYNVKPPLLIWFQSLGIWLFGPSELAIRLPSAMAALFTCFALFWFAKTNLNKVIGLFAVLFLVTSQGYIRPHVSRTGDLDSMLVFFITVYSLLFFLPTDPLEETGFAIRALHREYPAIQHYKVLILVDQPEHIDQANFYIKSLNRYKGYDIQLIREVESLIPGDTVLSTQPWALSALEERFPSTPLMKIANADFLVVRPR